MRQNKKPKKALSYKKRTGKAAPAKKPVRDFTKDIHRVLDRAGSRGVTVKYLQEMAGVRRHEQQAFLLKLVELVDKIYIHEGGKITIKFKFEDAYEQVFEFINLNYEAIMSA